MAKEYRQNDIWVLELEELEWYGKSADQEQVRQEIVRRTHLEKCTMAVIMVTPDMLFPMCGQTRKHRVFEHIVLRTLGDPFVITTAYTCELEPSEYLEASEKQRLALLGKARDQLNLCGLHVPGRYQITVKLPSGETRIIESGRV